MNLYCKLPSGTLISKRSVDRAIETLDSLRNGFTIVEVSDEELFTNGSKIDAIVRFREKHDVGLAEAKAAIDFLRGELEGR